jgi:phosphate transport system permease protein
LIVAAAVSILTTVGIVVVLCVETAAFFGVVSPVEFFTGRVWSPRQGQFGVLPLVCGTLWIAFGSGVIAIPLGLLAALYLGEYADRRWRDFFKPVLEILAGIPSVVYGYFAVVFISPIIRALFPSADVFNVAIASIVVAVMIIPTVVSLSEDVLRAVPRSLREAGYALGATKFEVTTRVVLPAAASGIMASFLLAVSRAIGETMAVTLAAGSAPNLTWNPLHSVQTMTAYIVAVSTGEAPAGSIEYRTIFAVCATLFVMTLSMNIIAQWILGRVSERYE